MPKDKLTIFIVDAGVIAAAYAALTLLLAPVSFGIVQVRLSEVLCIFSMFTPAAIPGLTIGCLIANLVGGSGVWDVVLGSLATLIGSLGMYFLRKKTYLAPLVNVLSNGIIVGLMLYKIYGFVNAFLCILLVCGEEMIPLYVLGLPLASTIRKRGLFQS